MLWLSGGFRVLPSLKLCQRLWG